MSAAVEIVEVGPRDGLQNEAVVLPVAVRAELITRLAAAGLRRIEVTSFVHSARVPQMAEAESVVAALPPMAGAIGLVLNQRGAERALATDLPEISFTTAVSDSFCQRNQGLSHEAAITEYGKVARSVREAGRRLTLVLSTCFACPYEGNIAPAQVAKTVARLLAMAAPDELALADTLGVAAPAEVTHLFNLIGKNIEALRLRGHFHDTRRLGVANSLAALAAGATALDCSIGGTGGCPFAPGASGNSATEDLVYALERSGVRTGVNLPALLTIAAWLGEQLGHPPTSALSRAGLPQH